MDYKNLNRQRKKQLEFQMQNNELHAQIATVLELARESIASNGWNEKYDKIIKGIVDDLMLIHNNYQASFDRKRKSHMSKREFGDLCEF